MYEDAKEEVIARGDTRVVYAISDNEHSYPHSVVLKEGSVGINYQEVQTWKYAQRYSELQQQFAKIYDYDDDYNWILTERVDTSKGSFDDINTEILRNHSFLVDGKPEDVGISPRGFTVLVDYPYGTGSKN